MTSKNHEDSASYGTRRAFVIPLAIDAILAGILFFIVFPSSGLSLETWVLLVIFVVLLLVLIYSLRRKVVIGHSGVVIRGLLRKKEVGWDDVTNVDALVMKKRVYLLLTTVRGFHSLSNNLSDFSSIIARIFAFAGEEKIEPAARKTLEQVPRRVSDIVMLWLAAAIMTGVLCFKLIQ